MSEKGGGLQGGLRHLRCKMRNEKCAWRLDEMKSTPKCQVAPWLFQIYVDPMANIRRIRTGGMAIYDKTPTRTIRSFDND